MDGTEPDDQSPPTSPLRALVGLGVLLLVVVGVVFIVHRLQESAQMQDCIASGRTNCAPIEPPVRR